MRCRLPLIVLACALCASNALAVPTPDDVRRACESLYSDKKLVESPASCINDVNRGNPRVQTLLGIYFLGENEIPHALYLFQKGADAGDPSAQNGLGYLYQMGKGIEENRDKANEYFLKSAKQGNPDSQFWLGENLILAGDYINGFMWTEKAARSGSADAQFNLGVLYKDGKGTEEDPARMYLWLSLAVRNGNDKAKPFIDHLNAELPKDVLGELSAFVNDQLAKCPDCLRK